MSTAKRERAAAPPTYSARWKSLGGVGEEARYRALCTKPGCPGCLGHLYYYDLTRIVGQLQEAAAPWQRKVADLRAQWERTEVANRADNYPAYSRRLRRLTDERDFNATPARGLDEAIRIAGPEDQHRIRGWIMSPRLPRKSEDGIEHQEPPLYRGDSTDGYHIVRLGREPAGKSDNYGGFGSRRRMDAKTRTQQLLRHYDPMHDFVPEGQTPVPPCKIWCPNCESLNFVPVPEGMEAVLGLYRTE